MKLILMTCLLLSSPAFAGDFLKCRDRGNFMSSWYELWIERSDEQISGSLIFQTANGPKKLKSFNTHLIRDQFFSGNTTTIEVNKMKKSDFLEFSTLIDGSPFDESFKCPKVISRSSWGTSTAYRIFKHLNVPVQYNNGGFREVRKMKAFNGDFQLEVRQLGEFNYSYSLKVIDPVIRDSKKVKEVFKDLFDKEGRLNLTELKTVLDCSEDLCFLTIK